MTSFLASKQTDQRIKIVSIIPYGELAEIYRKGHAALAREALSVTVMRSYVVAHWELYEPLLRDWLDEAFGP